MKCWAHSVSECCDIQSGEHYISKGIFTEKLVAVEGFKKLGANEKIVSINNLVRNCLCRKHNSLLSPFDYAAIKLREAIQLSKAATHSEGSGKQKFIVDFQKFVRWILKTFINFSVEFKYTTAIDLNELAKLVYSNHSLKNYISFTFPLAEGTSSFPISVAIAPLEKNGQTIGCELEFCGLLVHCLISTKPEFTYKPIDIKFNRNDQSVAASIIFR